MFASAKADRKPVFLYWGAKWCPPCNQIKATVFNRQDFIERSRNFIPVYVDGDSPSAQRLGSRFKVSGYPTMILFTPDGAEITRLPGDVDAEQYMQVLALGMNGARPIKDTLAGALASGTSRLTPDDWRMLSFYSWEVDDQQLLAKDKVAPTLQKLAQACPADQPESATRLKLQALASLATAKDAKPRDDKEGAALLHAVLLDDESRTRQFRRADQLCGQPCELRYAAQNHGARTTDRGLERRARPSGRRPQFVYGRSPHRGHRASAGREDRPRRRGVARIAAKGVREQVARADRETTDPYARGAVISTAADTLAEAGLMAESDALLTAELSRSSSPYYYMLGLAANAKKRGDKAAALGWYEKAYAAADGPATRLQWGASYVSALVDMSPQDSARIENAATQVIGELKPTPDTFFGRNQKSLERMGKRLDAWNKGNEHAASVRRVRAQMSDVCGKLPASDPARAACDGALQPAKAAHT